MLHLEVKRSNAIFEGESEEFQCRRKEKLSVVMVTKWEFNGKILTDANHHVTISPPDTRHVLEIKSATVADSGKYTCFAQINGVLYRASEKIAVYRKGR